jgi:threonine dehydratase
MIGREQIEQAASRIAPHVRRTPTMTLPEAAIPGLRGILSFKLENLQVTGSFKVRGAFNRVLSEQSLPAAGLVAASGGNHGLAVAQVARTLGLPCEIFLPSIAPKIKRDQLHALGARVVIEGDVFAVASRAAEERARKTKALAVHPFDHAQVICGQGTLAMELEAQVPDLDTVLVAVGGGGFIAGIATWYDRRVRVIGVEPVGSPSLARALDAGRPVDISTGGLAADSLGCRRVGELGFAIAQRLAVPSLVVSEDAIRAAQRLMWREMRTVVEPGGAVALAAIVQQLYVPAAGERVGIVVCGGNADPAEAAFTSQ